MEQFNAVVSTLQGWAWGPVMILLLVGTGLYLTFRLRFLQLRYFGHSLKCISGKFDDPREAGDISHFQALCAALSATIGTGNIAGVATAIALGGPGAVFWMWITALVGMASKYTSCALALRYRVVHADGSASGGPMYFLARGLRQPWLGTLFAIFAGFASFGIGCAVQSNSVIDGIQSAFPGPLWDYRIDPRLAVIGGTPYLKIAIGVLLAFLVGLVIIGGIRRIARVATAIVPFMCAVYIAGALVILFKNASALPGAFADIFHYAFAPFAVGGGFVGVVIQQTVRFGVARGVFSNEAGLGSAPIAHAAAKTSEMAREGFVAMLGPFVDTIIVCSMTALVILCTGAWQIRAGGGELLYGPGGGGIVETVRDVEVISADSGKPWRVNVNTRVVRAPASSADQPPVYYEIPTSSALTGLAFRRGLGLLGHLIVAFGLVFFAYSTMISWSYYGDRCWEYLLGPRAVMPYRLLFCLFVVIGAMSGLELVWNIADTLNALMALPNLAGLLGLSGVVAKETRDYIGRMKTARNL